MKALFLYFYELWKVFKPLVYLWRILVAIGLTAVLISVYKDWVVSTFPKIEMLLALAASNIFGLLLVTSMLLLFWAGFSVWYSLYTKTSAMSFRLLTQEKGEINNLPHTVQVKIPFVLLVSNLTEIDTPIYVNFEQSEALKALHPKELKFELTHVSGQKFDASFFPLEVRGKKNTELHLMLTFCVSARFSNRTFHEQSAKKIENLSSFGALVVIANSHLDTFEKRFTLSLI